MVFNPENIKKVRLQALADKHNCAYTYVLFVLNGTRRGKSKLAKAIINDAQAIVDIIDGKVNDNTHRLVGEVVKKKIEERSSIDML